LKLVYTLETHVHADHVTAADALRKKLGSKSVLYKDAGAACGDILVTDNTQINVGSINIEVRHTPGHTNGCASYVVGNLVFTGDALLINGCGRTDFQMGNAGQLFDSIHQKIFSLPDTTLIYPGHDYNGKTVSTVGIEKQFNKRIGQNISKEDFIEIMSNLKLDYPLKIGVALPANLACGSVPINQSS
jgi:sulfur dioxygenase